ncbi:type I glutamate--ammonia ligase [Mycoplasma sp. P36-A1]|uniref:type I glutamate--ammonia ligase n=1 Tax=Mycoplasma sp. P36-A1 TaxID=3252900 RepID=UPI003C2B3735
MEKVEFIRKQVEENDIHFIRLQFTDLLGQVKSVEVPVSQLESVLAGEVMFDGSSIEGFVRIMEADMFLKPDFDTFRIIRKDEDAKLNIARIICDVFKTDGTPFVGDPRYILKNMLLKMRELGFANFNIGLEPEFYLLKTNADGTPSTNPNDSESYFDLTSFEMASDCLRDIVLTLENLGFEIEAAHHEVGPGQYEINFKYADVLAACDNLQTYKHVVKTVAQKHNLYATFMPKPFGDKAGNGMHVNCSLSDDEGNNVFYDPKGYLELSTVCQQWIAGIMKHARGLTAITNPIVNSYKRLTPGFEAPCYIAWSTENRSTFIRIPGTRKAATRTEIRSVDVSANPYLAMAAILAAGLDGIENELIPDKPTFINLFALTRKERSAMGIVNLPNSLKDALNSLEDNEFIQNAIGTHAYKKFVKAKLSEWNEYRHEVTQWEMQKYFSKL